MRLSIVVVTWNCTGALSNLVASMNRCLRSEPTLIVIDNASGDDPEPAARSWRGETVYARNDENIGYGCACNQGLERADGDAVVLLNPDTSLLDDGLTTLGKFALDQHALVGPRVLELSRSPQPSASGPAVGAWPWVRAVLPGRLTPRALLRYTEPWRLETTTEVAWLSGSCIAAPLPALRELGGFDGTIDIFAEDMELCLRAADHGIRTLFAPDVATIVHEGDVSTRQRFEDRGVTATALSRRAVLERRYGTRAARASARADILNLWLRVAAKTVLRSPTRRRDAAMLAAFRVAARKNTTPAHR